MNMKLVTLTTVCCTLALAQSALTFKDYKRLNKTESSINHVQDSGFEIAAKTPRNSAWKLSREAVVTDEHGYTQRGLGIKRTDPAIYSVSYQVIKTLKPNTRYVFGCKVRVTDSDGKASGAVGVEGGTTVWKSFRGNTNGWVDYRKEFSTSARKNAAYNVALFYVKGCTGTVSYDDIYIREAGGELMVGIMNPYNRLEGKDKTIRFSANLIGHMDYPGADSKNWQAAVDIVSPDGKLALSGICPIVKQRFSLDGSALAAGNYNVTVTIADTKQRCVLAEIPQLRLTVGAPALAAPKGAVSIDRLGRMIVDGKPYMPVGIYTGGETAMYEMRYFAESPFNCILAYGGVYYKFRRSPKSGAAALRELMDYFQQHDMKLIISLSGFFPKFDGPWTRPAMRSWGKECSTMAYDDFIAKCVTAVRDHPALLAWYITDELPAARYKELISRRNLLNRVDPYHPTTGVYFQLGELAAYSATQDVPSIDFYPIYAGKQQNQSLVDESMDVAKRIWGYEDNGEMPFLATHQMFSWGGNDPDKNKRYRMPTEHEMLAMSLLSAIKGAKGFIYYYFHDICYGAGATTDLKVPRFFKNWKDVCGMARELRELEPFIMSTAKAPQVTVKNIKGITRARAFVDERYGRIRVLISSIGPGEAEADITVPGQKQLRSRFGKTIRNQKDETVYHFKGTDVDCDILQRWPEVELDLDVMEMQKRKGK